MDEKKVRSRKGWLLCEITNKRTLNPICYDCDPDGRNKGYTGFGELYYSKKMAEGYARILDDEWNKDRTKRGLSPKPCFKVVKGTLTWEE